MVGEKALLFQTGYLTITEEQELGGKALYRLGYPDREVRQSLHEHLLRHLVQDSDRQTANSIRLVRLLEAHDCAGLKTLFHAFFASIPYHWYTNNHIAHYEGYYASVFYSCLSSRWPRWRCPAPPSPSCASAATPTSTASPATAST